MVAGLWKSKVRSIGTVPNTSRCHGGMGADKNCTGPEKASRVREKAACWHHRNNLDFRLPCVFVGFRALRD